MTTSPSAYMIAPAQITRTAPKRSATAPAKGWPTPHKRFCTAIARPKMSRPQPYSVTIGIWNRPAAARGPKVMSAMRQPAATMISGETRGRAAAAETEVGIGDSGQGQRSAEISSSAGGGQTQRCHGRHHRREWVVYLHELRPAPRRAAPRGPAGVGSRSEAERGAGGADGRARRAAGHEAAEGAK